MRRLRTLALAGLLTSLSVGPSPASAVPATLVFTGWVDVDCFGCGVPSPCHADLNILALTHTGTAEANWTADGSAGVGACTAVQPLGLLCLVTGTANGTVVGTAGTVNGLVLNFNWTRVGAVAVITVSGSTTGTGTAAFVVAGLVCGGAMHGATVAGAVAGV